MGSEPALLEGGAASTPPSQGHLGSALGFWRNDTFLGSMTANTLLLVSLQCEKCNLHFRHKSQLRLHLRQKHGAITNTKVQYRVSAADLPPELPKACWSMECWLSRALSPRASPEGCCNTLQRSSHDVVPLSSTSANHSWGGGVGVGFADREPRQLPFPHCHKTLRKYYCFFFSYVYGKPCQQKKQNHLSVSK